jgi:hypothetical protein
VSVDVSYGISALTGQAFGLKNTGHLVRKELYSAAMTVPDEIVEEIPVRLEPPLTPRAFEEAGP